jgi:hypothetical protein
MFGGRKEIIVEKQRGQGKSNTIFSSSITVSEAIHVANNLKAELKFTELETNFENRHAVFVLRQVVSTECFQNLSPTQ